MYLDGVSIARATGGRLVRGAAAGPVLTDTRALVPGAWFCALRGDRFDGWDFLEQAQAAGASGCLVTRPAPAGWKGGVVLVEDTTRALQDLGRYARSVFSVPVVGLTGSSGKTTTRTLISLGLSPLGSVHQTTGNLNNQLGVPMTLLAAPAESAALVVEMGTSSPGEIAALCELARPTVRLLLNVGPAHLLELGGLDGVAREKGAIFATAAPGDQIVANLDDPRVAALPTPAGVRRWTFGRTEGADVRLLEARIDPVALSTWARFVVAGGAHEVTLPAPGEHLALDAAAALACAVALGVDPDHALAFMARYEPVGMRLRSEVLPHGALALNDAYNANPQSMAASLRLLAALPGRRTAVLGDMLELGPDEVRWHRELAEFADGLGLDRLVLVGPRMSAAASVVTRTEVWSAVDGLELADRLAATLGPADRVLFKGSRGARVERILQRVQGARPGEGAH